MINTGFLLTPYLFTRSSFEFWRTDVIFFQFYIIYKVICLQYEIQRHKNLHPVPVPQLAFSFPRGSLVSPASQISFQRSSVHIEARALIRTCAVTRMPSFLVHRCERAVDPVLHPFLYLTMHMSWILFQLIKSVHTQWVFLQPCRSPFV